MFSGSGPSEPSARTELQPRQLQLRQDADWEQQQQPPTEQQQQQQPFEQHSTVEASSTAGQVQQHSAVEAASTAGQGQLDEQGQEQQPAAAVPWGLNLTATVLSLWLLGFWACAYIGVPTVMDLLGLDPFSDSSRVQARRRGGGGGRHKPGTACSQLLLTFRAPPPCWQALKHLLLDVLQLSLTLGLLRRALRDHAVRARPSAPAASQAPGRQPPRRRRRR